MKVLNAFIVVVAILLLTPLPIYASNNTTADCSACYKTVTNLTSQIQILQSNITDTMVSLATVQSQYTTCKGSLQSYKDKLEQCNMEKTVALSNLSKCQMSLNSTKTEKNMITGQLSSTKADLSSCKNESQHRYPVSVVLGAAAVGAGAMYYYRDREKKFGIRNERDGRQIGIRKIG